MSDTFSRTLIVSLPAALVEQMEAAVATGRFTSESDLIEQAVERQFLRLWHGVSLEELETAANDPEFLRDLEEVTHSFAGADAEAAGLIPSEI